MKPFLCDHHRAMVQRNPERSRRWCQQLRSSARAHLNRHQWALAVPYYGSAFETSGLLMNDNATKQDLRSFLSISLELIYTFRKSDYPVSLPEVMEIIRGKVSHRLAPLPVQTVMAPLMDVAYSALSEVDTWMETLLALNEADRHTLH